MQPSHIWLLICLAWLGAEAKDFVCKGKTKGTIKIGEGDSSYFKIQSGAQKTKCSVTYKKKRTCPILRFSCSQFNIKNKKASCRGLDRMATKTKGKTENYCKGTGPDLKTSASLIVSFVSKKKSKSIATCVAECVSPTTTTSTETTTTSAGSGPAELKNDELCGITGGQAECYFDCAIISSVQGSGQLIQNLGCLDDCFSSNESAKDYCIFLLLNDVISNGVCNLTDEFGYNPGPGIYQPVVTCGMDVVPHPVYGFDQTVVDKGTCSAETENLLLNAECRREIMEEQGFIQNTLLQLIQNSCNHNVSEYYVDFMQGNLPGGRKKRNAESLNSEEAQLHARVKRLAPAQAIYGSDGIRTKLEFENTKNRYSWICSLRSSGSTPEHLCAVSLLSLPPSPTVIVGAAHCTYLCRDADEGQVSPCCCSSGPDNCAGDTMLCGDNPGVAEMDGTDATIVCGEWQTKRKDDDELALDILEIIRHPNYNHTAGPISGNDIAVFKVKDTPLENRQSHNLHPACLPDQKTSASSLGIHAGWSKPPPLSFINNHAKEYAEFYDDFFKQWHYKMDILEKCEDPTTTAITGGPLTFPSNSSYPAGTVCAKDFSKQSCFSTGDSGSPLMVQGEDKSLFSIEGILSFVKGCDVFTFGTTNSAKKNAQLNQQTENPSTYTKLYCFLPWIAEQYGMVYEGEEDPSCSEASGNPDDGDEPCRITPSNLVELFTGEVECILPYYYKGTLYDGCILFEEDGFVYPIFRCPTRNITTKIDGINSFQFLPLVDGYCPEDSSDPTSPLNPNKTDCSPFSRRTPFSQCKNNCPGVQALGIIGG